LEAELQKRFEHHDPCEMMRELKLIFETHAAVESYEASKQFFSCMMEEGSSVSEHMFAMSGHAKKLSDMGMMIPNQLGIHRVLQSLPPSYKNFVMNYNMQNMNKDLPELFSMLKSAEVEIKKENQVLMVNKTTSFKKQGKPNKGNFKKGGKKVATHPEKPKAGPKPETVCYYCQGKGHWKRNCPKYLADLKSGHVKKKAYVKKLQPDKLEPKAEKCVFIGYPKETIGYTFYHRSEGKIFVAKNGSFLEKEFLTKEVTGRKVELDEVDEPSLIDQSSAVPEEVSAQPTPIGEEANDDDHEASNEEALNLADRQGNVPLLIGMEHWTAVKNILKYLKRTKDMFLCYGGDQELVVTSYTDASWNTDPDDSKSQSGYVFILNGAAVSWSSSKQCTVAKSSTESEYIAALEASSEAVWMKRFIVELGVVPSALDPLVIYCDNTGAIANAKEPRSHKKLKHIKLRFHSIREYIEDDHGAPSINFNQFLEKEKLKGNGSNFTDWFRHVRIFLTGGNLQYVLDASLDPPPPPAVSEDIKNVYETRAIRYSEVQCAILCSLEAELQKRFEHHDPCEMMRELKLIFETHAAVESYEASKQFFSCMMEEGSSVSEHMFAMSGHAKKLSDMGMMIPNQLGIHRVLQSLPPSYKNFVMNYNMQNMNKDLPELFSMLKSAEVEIKKENQVLMVNKTTGFKKQGKPNKGNYKKGGKKVAAHPEKPKAGPKPETVCYYCQGKGHWKRNCSKYLADLKSGHVKKKGIFDIHVIDVYLTGSRSSAWVFDTGSVAHICNSKQELRNRRSLARDEVTMRVGNGSKVDVISVGTLLYI
ncbi:hypothetical protein QYE76_048938, partial [Lolium multiflorum]